MKKALVLALLVGSSAVFAACTHTAETPAPATTEERTQVSPVSTAETTPVDGTTMEAEVMPVGEVKEFTLEAGSFYFKPNEIRVKKGDRVRVTVNAVSMMHDFVIDELNVKVPVTQSGRSNSVEFVASEAGTFQFYCSVGNHKAQGQTGTIVVEE